MFYLLETGKRGWVGNKSGKWSSSSKTVQNLSVIKLTVFIATPVVLCIGFEHKSVLIIYQ